MSYKPARKPKSEGKYDHYWYASRKIEDRVIPIYVGKDINHAAEKIEAWLRWNDDSYLSKWEWKTIGKVLGLGTTKKAIWESLRLIDNPKTKKRKKERRDE